MANWCYNVVTFDGDKANIELVTDLFLKMKAMTVAGEGIQLPDFLPDYKGYFFDIELEQDSIRYETKWAPNLAELQIVADKFNLSFELFYHELAMGIYGEAIYQNGSLEDVALDMEDFQQVSYDAEIDAYQFEGKSYLSEFEVYDILLERKKQSQ